MNNELDRLYSIPESIFLDKDLQLTDIRLYAVIHSFMFSRRECWASNNWLAEKIGVARRTIITSLNKLEEKGYILKTMTPNCRLLSIKFTPLKSNDPLDLGSDPEITPVIHRSPPSDPQITPPSDPEITQTSRSNISNKRLVNNIYNAREENVSSSSSPSLDPNYQYQDTLFDNSYNNARDGSVPMDEFMQTAFETFWGLYPKKKDKHRAKVVWSSQIKREEVEGLLDKLSEQVKKDVEFKGGFIPNPANYLLNRRWEDEIFVRSKTKDYKPPKNIFNDTSWHKEFKVNTFEGIFEE